MSVPYILLGFYLLTELASDGDHATRVDRYLLSVHESSFQTFPQNCDIVSRVFSAMSGECYCGS